MEIHTFQNFALRMKTQIRADMRHKEHNRAYQRALGFLNTRGGRAPISLNSFGFFRKLMISLISSLMISMPAKSFKLTSGLFTLCSHERVTDRQDMFKVIINVFYVYSPEICEREFRCSYDWHQYNVITRYPGNSLRSSC